MGALDDTLGKVTDTFNQKVVTALQYDTLSWEYALIDDISFPGFFLTFFDFFLFKRDFFTCLRIEFLFWSQETVLCVLKGSRVTVQNVTTIATGVAAQVIGKQLI